MFSLKQYFTHLQLSKIHVLSVPKPLLNKNIHMKYITCYFIDQYFRQLYKFFEQYKIWITIDESLHSSYIQATRNFILLIYRNHRPSIDYPHLKYFIIDRLWKVWMDVNTRRIRFISALRFPLCSYNTPIIALQWKCLWLINIFFICISLIFVCELKSIPRHSSIRR